ncbi:FecR domain-containing protein [Pseudomonas sp. NPDC086278]|uniref:FecR domain-containing protein n=1 Tax=Pseudomonas sp. NPDC086278 TaxID=3390646 RepID=UPI003D0142FB
MSDLPLERSVVREAARWYMRLNDMDHDAAQHVRFEQWRKQHPDHERAWQLAQRVSQQWQGIPSGVGLPTLDRADQLSRRSGLKALVLLMTAGPAALVAWRQSSWSADERTAIGEQRQINLPDGTQLNLNTQSAVDIVFDATQRLIRLRAGEILVTTAQDRLKRPLLVQTDQGNVRPVGTRFSVRLEEAQSLVSVFAGAVDIQPNRGNAEVRLNAGQNVRFDNHHVLAATALPAGSGDWAQGVLRVERMPLSAFVRELNRYRPGWIRCEPQVGELLISGAFQLRDTDLVLSAVSRALPVSVVYRTRYWVTLQSRLA